jgi:7-carboxy-7-deazaguanine synthase
MAYIVKEIFYTLQGEGLQTGRPAVFCRFSGCNLWSGREEDRVGAKCRFCDTDFVGDNGTGGGVFNDAQTLARAIIETFPQEISSKTQPFVVLTGGEPGLQVDGKLVEALHTEGFEIAIETNGTLSLPEEIDWVTVSPKAKTELVIRSGDELKLVYPQEDITPGMFEDLHFRHFLLQPQDGPDLEDNTRQAVKYCLTHPRWRLSLQTHKILGIP